jgi:hypothetical protein
LGVCRSARIAGKKEAVHRGAFCRAPRRSTKDQPLPESRRTASPPRLHYRSKGPTLHRHPHPGSISCLPYIPPPAASHNFSYLSFLFTILDRHRHNSRTLGPLYLLITSFICCLPFVSRLVPHAIPDPESSISHQLPRSAHIIHLSPNARFLLLALPRTSRCLLNSSLPRRQLSHQEQLQSMLC